ncbi:tyrosine-type recombinase/integrase [Nonomuraea rubra]
MLSTSREPDLRVPGAVHHRTTVPRVHQRGRWAAVVRRRPPPLAGLPCSAGVKIDIHQLLHAHATELINAGVSIAAVRRRLGHASTETTQLYADSTITAGRRRRRRRNPRRPTPPRPGNPLTCAPDP